VTMCKTALLLL